MATLVTFNYSINSPTNTWNIFHNLNALSVNVDVMVLNAAGQVEKILPDNIEVTNSNTVVVTFVNPHAGFARITGSV